MVDGRKVYKREIRERGNLRMNYTHAGVASLDPQTMRTLCEEYLANNYIDPETSERLGVKRGLRNPDGTGVLAGLTNVCDVVGYKKDQEGHVIPIPGRLIYRGVDINEIVNEAYRNDRFVFEEVIWLLLFGSLPTQEQLDDFCELLAEHRALPDGFMDTMNAPSPNIMNKMQRCVLGLYSYDEHAEDLTLENILNQSINLIASMPTMMVNAYQMKRRYYDKQSMFFHMPKPGQSTAEHILSTYRPDQKFTHEEAKLLDMCLLVHADHGGGNCSTFTTRVLSSSGTDTYSAISAAIGALKGPKHGGANLMVNRQLQDILKHVENPEDVTLYFSEIENGFCNVYREGEDTIYSILAARINLHRFDQLGLVNSNQFNRDINLVERVVIDMPDDSYVYGLNRDSGQLAVTLDNEQIDADLFTKLFKIIISSRITDFAEKPEGAEPAVRITVRYNAEDRKNDTIAFYPLNDRLYYMELNDTGSFSVSSVYIDKLIDSIDKLNSGEDFSDTW